MDAGAGMQVVVDRVRYFPNLEWKNVANNILEANV